MKITRVIKYNLIRLFRLKSGPHQVASGVTIGFIPSWLPTFGLGPVLSVGMARFLKANTVSALVGGVLGTFIWPLLFFLNYKVGSLLLDRNTKVDELDEVEYIDAIEHTYTGIVSSHSSGFIFLTGAMCNIVISSIFIYIMVYIMFKTYRVRILNRIR
ncbi:DUF2062 domain-containing protein [Solibacillus sp. FSL W7-1472]|uniref:DUF2062 domain-containing protein n=1 Tax=Solibacillus isronensis B3W22 TaxID=1224748 RepID=K1LN50_9BACL|nr:MULTISPECIES: DUF2062 domain-containing protein [Solibacillus]AMO86719.1 hypothetical protein SOLI23_14430 [Solibacillus silvestris]EKB45624.1 hypothetical protein B857_01575 [Solibacillus isronensis B3W22]OBW57054.1 hypothetical protein A9986_09930 [Solibacillus silvestris]